MKPGIDIIIRPVENHEYSVIEKLLTGCGLPTAGIREKLSGFLVADCSGVVGVIGMEFSGKSVLIRSLAVSPDRRNLGIAASLINQSLNRARLSGCNEAYLITGTAEKYMHRWGFNSINRSQFPLDLLRVSGLYQACPSCSTCMKLDL